MSFPHFSPNRTPSQTLAAAAPRQAQPAPRTVSGLTASLLDGRSKPRRSDWERFDLKGTIIKLLTNAQTAELLANGAVSAQGKDHDPKPVVKLFTPVSNATWLLTELDPADPDVSFRSLDLGLGCPELGYVRISELQSARGRLGPLVERDMHFTADGTLSEYAAVARSAGGISA